MGLPLDGLRVIDLTQDFAGPICTMMLSELGAEVVKIEKPDGGDETRSWVPPWINGTSYYFQGSTGEKKGPIGCPKLERVVFYFSRSLEISLFASSKASFTLSSSTTTSSWIVSSLIFFASLRASLMSSEICFSLGGRISSGRDESSRQKCPSQQPAS